MHREDEKPQRQQRWCTAMPGKMLRVHFMYGTLLLLLAGVHVYETSTTWRPGFSHSVSLAADSRTSGLLPIGATVGNVHVAAESAGTPGELPGLGASSGDTGRAVSVVGLSHPAVQSDWSRTWTLPRTPQWPDGYAAICTVAKDQHRDIREWLEYHAWIGVAKVYLYDHNSTDPMLAVVNEYVHAGFVEYSYFTGKPRARPDWRVSNQGFAYADCFRRFRTRHRWIAFLDVDEFIVLRNDGSGADARLADGVAPDLNAFLREFERHPALGLNWRLFTSSGHKARPPGGVLANYRTCIPGSSAQSNHVKLVVNTAHATDVGGTPHEFTYRTSAMRPVNAHHMPFAGPFSAPPTYDRAVLYHYVVKSWADFQEKIRRGTGGGNVKTRAFWELIEGLGSETCDDAVQLARTCCPALREGA